MDFRPTEEQVLLRRSVREFAETEIRPHVREWDQDQHFPIELMPKLAALGLLGIQFPEQYGGAAMSAIDYCICIEELARVDPAVALSVAAHNGLCSSHISLFGTEAQKQRYLVPLVRGEKIGAWGLTEPTSGSDAAGMRTTATRAGTCWVLNGSKTFTTHGRVGDVAVVMAVTDRTAGAKGISAFIVEKGTPGLAPGKKEDKLGMRASDTSEMIFENCRLPADQLLGDEGLGFVHTMQVLDAGRIGIAALAVGLAQGAYEAALGYARERKAFGKSISSFQAIQWKLADAATKIEAARLLTYRAAFLKERGRRTTLESAMAKLYASEIAVKVADDCVQIHGGYGFVKDYPAEKYFRDVKLTTIGEGTSEIQRLVIARQLLSRS
ncbi:MAG: acyl-CoA dehydrogenase [Acidobacteria bacterium]|nr:MAG: acyl-CoA dehydrogenase [Acidobacteriota bacterium]PYR19787.1 MAG: acyl-CoA dehydrogenase [Acidobacteriota bacterium]PYR54291.1 MAG: acyl-CoA dehydrogenase [Acidobacteriota bacterium]